MLSSFVTCVMLTGLGLWAGQWWVTNSTLPNTIRLSASGTVLVRLPGRAEDVANPDPVPVGSRISTDPGVQATLIFYTPDGVNVLATVQMYGDTRLRIAQADTPRFSLSPHEHRIRLLVELGRVRAIVGPNTGRPVKVDLLSEPQAWTVLQQPGSNASVEAGLTQTTATVREGEAVMISLSQNKFITLHKDERAEVASDGDLAGPLPAERNLIVNGDFSALFAPDNWVIDPAQRNNPEDDIGQIDPLTREGRPAIKFLRLGNDWGQLGVTQLLNRDVRDYTSLRLHLDVYVGFQDLYNCGASGTECPVMVKLLYLDVNGNEQQWLQGFYANPNPNVPTECVTCPPPRNPQHELVSFNQWETFESNNLLEAFNAAGLPAVTLKSITIYASGHAFESYVTDVQLLGAE